jgi:hypothetical protein
MMQGMKRFGHWACVLAVAGGLVFVPDLFAANPLGGAALETGCRAYADKAVKNAQEWKRLDCGKKLNLGVQLMDTDFNFHFNRCRNSIGTTIDTDLKFQEEHLKKCPGFAAGGGTQTQGTKPPVMPPPATQPPVTPPMGTRPPPPPPTDPPTPPPANPGAVSAADVWDLVVINSVTLGRSQQTYHIATLSGQFKARNVVADNLELEGSVSGAAFEAVATDKTGYRANLYGRLVSTGRVEGTGCDNRGRGFSFALNKR